MENQDLRFDQKQTLGGTPASDVLSYNTRLFKRQSPEFVFRRSAKKIV
jgi:hypothetical protein